MADGSVIISTELDNSGISSDLKTTKKEAQKAADAVEKYGDEFDEARKKSKTSKDKIVDDLDDVKLSLKDVASTLATGLGFGAIISFGNELIETTEELRGDLANLDQNARTAGVGLEVTRDAMQTLNTVTGETDSSIEAVSNLLAAGVPENKLQAAVEGLANAAITFPDTIKIESLADSLQETLATGEATGQFGELLDRLGIGAENFSEQLAACTTEVQKQDLALSVLSSGSLNGVYEGWAKTNPELVESRDATLQLQEAMADLATELLPIKTDLTEFATTVASFVASNVDLGNVFDILVSGVGALGAVKAITVINSIVESIMGLGSALSLASVQSGVAVAGFTALIYLLLQLTESWDDMSGAQKIVAALGLITAAALTAAVAVGAFQSALTLGIAAAAIVAGIAAVMLAINSASSQAKQYATIEQWTPEMQSSIPQLATGAVIPPNQRFTAVLGDQKHGNNLEAPESLIRKIVREEAGGSGTGVTQLTIDGKVLARLIYPYTKSEGRRRGVNLVEGGTM